MKDDILQRAEDEATFLLSKDVGDAKASAMEHLAGAILLAAVVLAKSRLLGDTRRE